MNGRSDLHCVREHSSEAKWYFFGELLAVHGNFETVAEVNMNHFASYALQQQIGWVSIS
jgi:hypothetical protein